MPRRKRYHKQTGIAVLILFLVIASFLLIRFYAEYRTEDFIIDNYLLPQNIYPDATQARDNMVLEETQWSFSHYCMVASVYFGTGSERISTSIILKTPMLSYALNTDKAVDEMQMVGEC